MILRKNSCFTLFPPPPQTHLKRFLLLTPKVLTTFTFLTEKILEYKIEAFILPKNMMTKIQKTKIKQT